MYNYNEGSIDASTIQAVCLQKTNRTHLVLMSSSRIKFLSMKTSNYYKYRENSGDGKSFIASDWL